MKRILFAIILCVSITAGSMARAGVEPSPFKDIIQSKIDTIVTALMPLTQSNLGAVPTDVQNLAIEVVDYLQSVDTNHIPRQLVAMRSVVIMEKVSAVMFDPQPEPPGYQLNGLQVLSTLARVSFDPQPEPPGRVDQTLTVLERITAAGFDPQPEPPGIAKLTNTMGALNGIAAIAFDPQPEPPGKSLGMMAAFDAVTAVAFDPQPEPPGHSVSEMFDIMNMLQVIAAPQVY